MQGGSTKTSTAGQLLTFLTANVPGTTLGTIAPAANGTAAAGTAATAARSDHVHPTDATRAPLSDPRFAGVVANVATQGAKGDGVTDDIAAFNAALAILYANKGGILEIPHANYATSSPVVIDVGQYSGGRGIVVRMNGSVFSPTHADWCFKIPTNYFGSNNGGSFGRKVVTIEGQGALITGINAPSNAAGAMQWTDVVGITVRQITATEYRTGTAFQLYCSTTNPTTPTTWCEENSFYELRESFCLTYFETKCNVQVASFLGNKFYHCVGEGHLNNTVLFKLAGGLWNSSFIACGGFYDQDGSTGGTGFYLNGSYMGATFVSCFSDTGQDSSGAGAGTLAQDVVFGPNYTTDLAWLPTFIGCNELNLPAGWRDKILVPGPFPFLGSQGGQMSANPREVLRSVRTYYVALSGSDTTGDGLTVGTPFATMQHAVDTIYRTLDLSSTGAIIQCADGTYTAPLMVQGLPTGLGSGSIILSGNTTTPGNVKIASTSGPAISVLGGAQLSIRGVTWQTTSGPGLLVDGASQVTILAGCQAGACTAGSHIQATSNSLLSVLGAFKFTGNAQAAIRLASGAQFVHGAVAIDATGIAWTTNFCDVGDHARYILNSGTYVTTGSSSTNASGFVHTLGLIQTYGTKPQFPGTGAVYADGATSGIYN